MDATRALGSGHRIEEITNPPTDPATLGGDRSRRRGKVCVGATGVGSPRVAEHGDPFIAKTTGTGGPFPPMPGKITHALVGCNPDLDGFRNFFRRRTGEPIHGHV